MRRRTLLAAALSTFVKTYPARLGELTGLRGAFGPWRAGYGPGAAPPLALALEATVRLAELGGLGLVYSAAEIVAAGRRYRRLRDVGEFVGAVLPPRLAAEYARAYDVRGALLDRGARRVAGRLGVAYVAGRVVKVDGEPSAPLLLHELVHVGQFRRWGWAYVAKALWALWGGGGYAYPAWAASPFGLSAEQEAAWWEDRAREHAGLPARWARAGA